MSAGLDEGASLSYTWWIAESKTLRQPPPPPPWLPPIPPGLKTWVQMIRTFWTLQSKVEDSLKKHKLTLAQFDLLAMLPALEGLNQQELADQLAVTKGNMVGLVNRLSRRGFVQRAPAQKGRRGNVIHLTKAGERLVRAALPDHWELVTGMMSPLKLKELQELFAMLRRLEEAALESSVERVREDP